MAETPDREARLEEIRERVEAHERGVKGAAHGDEASDLRFLLSEIDRLREIEEEVREVADHIKEMGWLGESTPGGNMLTRVHDRLKAKLEGEDEQD